MEIFGAFCTPKQLQTSPKEAGLPAKGRPYLKESVGN
jgi:hypothetical protein